MHFKIHSKIINTENLVLHVGRHGYVEERNNKKYSISFYVANQLKNRRKFNIPILPL